MISGVAVLGNGAHGRGTTTPLNAVGLEAPNQDENTIASSAGSTPAHSHVLSMAVWTKGMSIPTLARDGHTRPAKAETRVQFPPMLLISGAGFYRELAAPYLKEAA